MDKKSFAVSSLHEKETNSYWKDKSAIEKIEALEQLRRIIFGYDPTTSRLQRTITITEFKRD